MLETEEMQIQIVYQVIKYGHNISEIIRNKEHNGRSYIWMNDLWPNSKV
jgi:hypothetical protein